MKFLNYKKHWNQKMNYLKASDKLLLLNNNKTLKKILILTYKNHNNKNR